MTPTELLAAAGAGGMSISSEALANYLAGKGEHSAADKVRALARERDAARAEVERLRAAIREALGDLSEHAEPYGRAAIESAHKKLRAVWLATLAAKEEQQ